MLKKSKTIGLIIGLTIVLTGLPIFATDFETLLNAVEKIENNLKELVQKEESSRKGDIADLRKSITKLESTSNAGQTGVTDEQMVNIINELASLWAEVQSLKISMEGSSKLLVSNNPDSWAQSGSSDKQFDQLAEKLAVLNENVEILVANKSKHPKTPKNKSSGSKTTVNGRLYSHGMVDFSENNDNYNEFALSRAYVTLKSKLSSNASIRITSDMRSIDDKYNIILKYAYLDWKPGFMQGNAKLRFGLQPTQYIDQMNKLWGRRYLEKTVGDKKKFLTSSDLGVSTIIGFGSKSKYGYASMALLNGTSYSSVNELNSNKDINLFSLVKPFKDLPAFHKSTLMMQFYSGTQNKVLDDIVSVDTMATPWDSTVTVVGASDWKRNIVSLGGLLAWNSTVDFGFDMNITTVGKGAGKDAVKKRGLSFFGTFYLKKLVPGTSFMNSINFFGRVDSYDPSTNSSNDSQTMSFFGIESIPVKGFKVALNYRTTSYENDTSDSESMLFVNTLFKF